MGIARSQEKTEEDLFISDWRDFPQRVTVFMYLQAANWRRGWVVIAQRI
jgi:hypothetical protein